MAGFEDYFLSLSARDAFEDLIIKVIDEQRPKYRYGIVDSVDTAARIVQVTFIGETTPTPIQLGASKVDVGQYVRVAGLRNDRYIDMPGGGGAGTPTIDMGEAGILTGWSKPWYFHTATVLSAIAGTLTVADSSNTILATVGEDGVSLGTVSIPAGQLIGVTNGPFSFDAGTYWQMQVSSGSPTAQGLSWFGIL